MGCQRTDPGAVCPQEALTTAARGLGVPLSPSQTTAFARYAALLAEHGARFNLTAVLDPAGIQTRHFAESLAVGAALRDAGRLTGDERIVDVGSGAGFPGLPLALAWPGLRVTLIEATGKKARFLETVVRELGLGGVSVVCARAEDAARDAGLRERFDIATARAVARLASLAELLLPFVRVGGAVAAVKSSRAEEERSEARNAIVRCGGDAAGMLALAPPEGRQRLVVIEKRRPTPASLPRRSGQPVHDPLR